MLGTGGAAKAVAAALEDAGAEVVVRGRRDPAGRRPRDGFDVLVNATPVKDELDRRAARRACRSWTSPTSPTGARPR